MKRLFARVGLVLAVLVWPARAQNLDEQYVRIYNLIQQGDALDAAGNRAQSLARYLEAQASLQKLQQLNPSWNEKVVKFRLNYLATKIGNMTTQSTPAPQPAPAKPGPPAVQTPVPAEIQRELAGLQEAVRRLQADRTVLEAKLKEALAAQPAAIDPRELAKAESKVQSLMKENDLLKATLAQEQAKPPPGAGLKTLEQTKLALDEANRKLAEQTERADSLAVEKHALLTRLDGLNSNSPSATTLDENRKNLEEANRRLTLRNEVLQLQVRELTASAEAADALRAENQLLKRQLADAKSAGSGKTDETVRQLQQAQAQLAALQSDAEIMRLEKIALQNRVKQMSAAPAITAPPKPAQTADLERIKQLEQEREGLRKKLDAANKELYGRDSRKVAARMDELSNEIATLRARLQVFEARTVPYTAEELAMMKQPAPSVAPSDPNAGKKSTKDLPTGTASLAAEAQRLFSAREFAKAEEKYVEMLRQDEKNAYTLANLAAIQLELNRLDEAEKNIKQALVASPDDAFSLSILGYVRFRQEKFDEALDALSRAAKLNPDSAEIQNYLGVTLSHKGLRGPAETALRKAITLDPRYGSAHNNLAVIYLSQQPPYTDLARWHYQKALGAGHPPNAELEKLLAPKAAKTVVLPRVD